MGPLLDRIEDHCDLDRSTGVTIGKTPTGESHCALLKLNRPSLIQNRLQERLLGGLLTKLMLMEKENQQLRAVVAAQKDCIAQLIALLGE